MKQYTTLYKTLTAISFCVSIGLAFLFYYQLQLNKEQGIINQKTSDSFKEMQKLVGVVVDQTVSNTQRLNKTAPIMIGTDSTEALFKGDFNSNILVDTATKN